MNRIQTQWSVALLLLCVCAGSLSAQVERLTPRLRAALESHLGGRRPWKAGTCLPTLWSGAPSGRNGGSDCLLHDFRLVIQVCRRPQSELGKPSPWTRCAVSGSIDPQPGWLRLVSFPSPCGTPCSLRRRSQRRALAAHGCGSHSRRGIGCRCRWSRPLVVVQAGVVSSFQGA